LSTDLPAIVVSSGEPAGIGPDICLALAAEPCAARWAVLGDASLLAARAAALGLDVELDLHQNCGTVPPHHPGRLQVLPVPLRVPAAAGRLDPANAPYVLEQLDRAVALCMRGECRALVTAPVQKSVINEAGIPFTGHTEYLAQRTAAPLPVMMLVTDALRVALATTHLPLARVPAAINAARIEQIVKIMHEALIRAFGIARPRIQVLGLNPHAGERGALGNEETQILEPALARLRAEGLNVIGPVPADTAFTRERLALCDAVLAMYHDQGLPVIKALSFGEVVNVTLGLPIVRTSVDHGTALDLAGSGHARHDSLRAALELALRMAARSS
jgi:4-hydroxythreonine-4-phosphate dehydrogenase